MIVVSDASPINLLVQIHCAGVLPALFEKVTIPPAVARELSHPATPAPVRELLADRPRWLRVQSPSGLNPRVDLADAGEREAISLAIELHADYLLADDRKARRIAKTLGLTVMGAIGVLETASARRLIDLPGAVARIRQTDFIVSEHILEQALRRDAERRRF